MPIASWRSLSRLARSWATRPSILVRITWSCGSFSTLSAWCRSSAICLYRVSSSDSSPPPPPRPGGPWSGPPGPSGGPPGPISCGGIGRASGGGPAIGPSADIGFLLVRTHRAAPVLGLLHHLGPRGHAAVLAKHLDRDGQGDDPVVVAAQHRSGRGIGLGVDEGAQLLDVPGRDPGEEPLPHPVLEVGQHLLAQL